MSEVPFISLTWKKEVIPCYAWSCNDALPPRSSRPTSRIFPRKPTRVSSIRSLLRSPPTSLPRRRPRRRGMSPPRTIATLTLSGATSCPSPSPCSPSSRTWARRAPLDLGTVIAPLHPLLWNLRHRLTYSIIRYIPTIIICYTLVILFALLFHLYVRCVNFIDINDAGLHAFTFIRDTFWRL